jgi:hypothetical protein
VCTFRVAQLLDDAEDLVFLQNQQLVAIDFDFRAGIFAEENAVAGFHFERGPLARIQEFAITDSLDQGLLGLLLRAVGDDDPTAALLTFFQPFYENSIVQGA